MNVEKYWGNYTIFEIWLFCTAFNCQIDINDGKIKKVTCTLRRNLHED